MESLSHPQSRTSVSLLQRLRGAPSDAAAWEQFLNLYGPRIERLCKRWGLQDADAQDISQDILLRLSKRLQTFEYDPAMSFRGWLRKVTENTITDFRNSQRAGIRLADGPWLLETAEARADVLAELDEAYNIELLLSAHSVIKATVAPQHWHVFELMVDQNISGRDAASQCHVTLANAYVIKSRIQKLIRREIQRLQSETNDDHEFLTRLP